MAAQTKIALASVVLFFFFAGGDRAKAWELRGGLYNHGLESVRSSQKEGGLAINLEVQAPPLLKDKWGTEYFRWRAGSSLSLSGLTHIFYSGFAFEFAQPIAPFFIAVGFDMAVHTGKLRDGNPGRNRLGCRWAFHESLSIGWDIVPHHRVMVSVEHISNAKSVLGACPYNDGLSNIGARYSYRF